MRCLLVLFLYLAPTTLLAWNHYAHQLVAQIAYEQLSPEARAYYDDLSQHHLGVDEKFQSFAKGSTWLDALRAEQFPFYDHLHYTTTPYDPENILDSYSFRLLKSIIRNNDVVWALKKSYKILDSKDQSKNNRAFALKLLSHFIADIHQPLHVVSRFSSKNMFGDHGGNKFKVESKVAHNLHKYWDSGCELFSMPGIDLDGPGFPKILQKEALALLEETAPIQDQINVKFYPDKWRDESYNLAEFIYSLKEGEPVPKKYKLKGQEICKRRVIEAGLRLAFALNEIYAKQVTVE